MMGLGIFMLTAQADVFPDVPVTHEYAEAIDYLTKENIINGYPDGLFRSEQEVNRAEALKILLLANKITSNTFSQNEFLDVFADDWFASFISTARNMQIINGYPDGYFRPEKTVNLSEALKMLLTSGEVRLDNYETDSSLFADTRASAWYNPFLVYAQRFDLIKPNAENQIFPATPLTRGKLAGIVHLFLTRTERACPHFLENVKTIPAKYFGKIILEKELPNVFYENEVFLLSGSVQDNASHVTAFFTDEVGKQTAFVGDVENGIFTIPTEFRAPGLYQFSVIPSLSGQSYAASIEVVPHECAPASVEISSNPPLDLSAGIENNQPIIRWQNSENNLTRVVLRQGEKRYERIVSAGQSSLILSPADFEEWIEGSATVQVFGSSSENGFSYEPRTRWVGGASLTVNPSQHHFSDWKKDDLAMDFLPSVHGSTLTLSGKTKVDLEPAGYVINPDGTVTEVSISKSSDIVPANTSFALSLDLPSQDTYIFELNNMEGIAVLNYPFYAPGDFPLLPDFMDLREEPNPNRKISFNRERAIWLRTINDFRSKHHLSPVRLDEELTNFSQEYAEQMAAENFFSHTDLAGRDPDERRKAAGLQLPIGENLARETETAYAHAGLLRSAVHRLNMLNPEWRRVGLGIAETGGNELIFVQEFSADLLVEENLAELKDELLQILNNKRGEVGQASLTFDLGLEPVTQAWSNKMMTESFFGFESGGSSLEKDIRAIDSTSSFASYLASASRLSELAGSLSEENEWLNAEKSRVAIGLTQDEDGMFLATFVFR